MLGLLCRLSEESLRLLLYAVYRVTRHGESGELQHPKRGVSPMFMGSLCRPCPLCAMGEQHPKIRNLLEDSCWLQHLAPHMVDKQPGTAAPSW